MNWHRAKKKTKNKYGAKGCTIDGHKFPSRKEGRHYLHLKAWEADGGIRDLKIHPKYYFHMAGGNQVLIKSKGFPNGRKAYYEADASFILVETGELVVQDVKALDKKTNKFIDTKLSKFKRACLEAEQGITVELV
tara:strand:+ start:663 stop:1067 length:405 start_codon:yes stop_codon:yes gene_type:complete